MVRAVVSFGLIVAFAGSAVASPQSIGTLLPGGDDAPRHEVSVRAGWTHADVSDAEAGDVGVSAWRLGLDMEFQVADEITLVAGLPMVVSTVGGFSDSLFDPDAAMLGNPTLGVMFSAGEGPRHSVDVGFMVAFPGSDDAVDGTVSKRLGMAAAAASRASRELWRYRPNTVGLVVPVDARVVLDGLFVELDLDLALMLPTGERAFGLVVDSGLFVGRELSRVVTLGAWVHNVFVPTNSSDAYQLGLEPQLRLQFGDVRVEAGVSFQFGDSPTEGFEGALPWGLHSGVSFAF